MAKLQQFFYISLLMMSSISGSGAATDSGYQQFVGDWELVSYVVFATESGGEDREMNYVGYLSYDAHGNMAGLGMPQELPEQARRNDQARGGFAYWGRVTVDTAARVVTHHVDGSPTQPRWVGGDNVRHYEFEEDFLKLSLKNESGMTTATLTWRRLP